MAATLTAHELAHNPEGIQVMKLVPRRKGMTISAAEFFFGNLVRDSILSDCELHACVVEKVGMTLNGRSGFYDLLYIVRTHQAYAIAHENRSIVYKFYLM